MAGGRCRKGRVSSSILGVDDSGVDRVPTRRIRRPGIRVNSKGILYVPDSEDDDSEMEVEDDGGVAGKEAVERPPCVVLEGAPRVMAEAAPGAQATAGGIDGRNVLIEGPMANDATAGDDLKEVQPDVPEALKEVLAHMDPIYHDVFVSIWMVPPTIRHPCNCNHKCNYFKNIFSIKTQSWDDSLGQESGDIPLVQAQLGEKGHLHEVVVLPLKLQH